MTTVRSPAAWPKRTTPLAHSSAALTALVTLEGSSHLRPLPECDLRAAVLEVRLRKRGASGDLVPGVAEARAVLCPATTLSSWAKPTPGGWPSQQGNAPSSCVPAPRR